MLSVLIVDDEQPARDEIKYLLSLDAEIAVVAEADNGADAIRMAADLKPDVVFMDINMREMSGMEAAKVIRGIVPGSMIVFATAYDAYALKAFEVGAVDYLLKPIDEARLLQTITRMKQYCPREWAEAGKRVDDVLARGKIQIHKLPVEKAGKIVLIRYEEILYAYAHTGNVIVVTADDEMNYAGTLSELEEHVKESNLLRVHKSYLVNMDQIIEVVPWFKGTYWLKLAHEPKIEIPVSKSQIKEIKEILGLK